MSTADALSLTQATLRARVLLANQLFHDHGLPLLAENDVPIRFIRMGSRQSENASPVIASTASSPRRRSASSHNSPPRRLSRACPSETRGSSICKAALHSRPTSSPGASVREVPSGSRKAAKARSTAGDCTGGASR